MEALIAKFKKMSTAQIMQRMDKLVNDEKEACLEILKQRGQDVTKWVKPIVSNKNEPVFIEIPSEDEENGVEEQEDIEEVSSEKDAPEETKIAEPVVSVTKNKKEKVLVSKIVPGIKAGIKVSFKLNNRRGGEEVSGTVSHIHVRGDHEYVIIKISDGMVSKVPKALTILN